MALLCRSEGVDMLRRPRQARALVIDDERGVRLTLRAWLEKKESFRVFTASNGRKGLRIAWWRIPSVILLDIEMPGLNGIEVLKKLKKSKRTRYIPVVILTGNPTAETKEDASYEYAEHYLTKPITSEALREKLKAVLKRRHVRSRQWRI
jgi:response regulator RpfG family c-di-GMP phosphodiesterase